MTRNSRQTLQDSPTIPPTSILTTPTSEDQAKTSEGKEFWNEEALRQFNQINLTALLKIASRLKNKTCIPLIQNTRFDRSNITIFLSFENPDESENWLAKFPLTGGGGGKGVTANDDHLLEQHIESMVVTMKYVSERTSIPVPKVHHWECSSLNEFGRPYVIMDSPRGNTLYDLDGSGLIDMDKVLDKEESVLSSFIDQWAQYHAELTSLQFDKIGNLLPNGQIGPLWTPAHLHFSTLLNGDKFRGPFISVPEYLLTVSEYKCRSLAGSAIGHSYRVFLQNKILESMVPFFVEQRYGNGPFVLKHPELDLQNILVEGDERGGFRITGVVGWEFSCVGPLQSQMCLPQSLILDEESAGNQEKNELLTWRMKFARKYRDEYKTCYLRHLKLNLDYPAHLIESGYWFAKFERAISIGSAEECFTLLWSHIYGKRIHWQEVILKMESSDWGLAMAERFASDEPEDYYNDGANTIIVSHSRPHTQATFRPCWKPKVRWRMRVMNNLRWGLWRFEQCLLCQLGEKRVAVLMKAKRRATMSEIVDNGSSIKS
jgi:hypothetical protein